MIDGRREASIRCTTTRTDTGRERRDSRDRFARRITRQKPFVWRATLPSQSRTLIYSKIETPPTASRRIRDASEPALGAEPGVTSTITRTFWVFTSGVGNLREAMAALRGLRGLLGLVPPRLSSAPPPPGPPWKPGRYAEAVEGRAAERMGSPFELYRDRNTCSCGNIRREKQKKGKRSAPKPNGTKGAAETTTAATYTLSTDETSGRQRIHFWALKDPDLTPRP
eukprot:1192922-Prorocentrum_minimum.AAC.1